MEYFLPLSVMAMIISSISIFLIENQNPPPNTDPENDLPTSNPSEKIEEDPVDEFTVSENEENIQKNIASNDKSDQHTLNKTHSTGIDLKAFQQSFSIWWNSTPTYSNEPNIIVE